MQVDYAIIIWTFKALKGGRQEKGAPTAVTVTGRSWWSWVGSKMWYPLETAFFIASSPKNQL
jgi:hypothetical protein